MAFSGKQPTFRTAHGAPPRSRLPLCSFHSRQVALAVAPHMQHVCSLACFPTPLPDRCSPICVLYPMWFPCRPLHEHSDTLDLVFTRCGPFSNFVALAVLSAALRYLGHMWWTSPTIRTYCRAGRKLLPRWAIFRNPPALCLVPLSGRCPATDRACLGGRGGYLKIYESQ